MYSYFIELKIKLQIFLFWVIKCAHILEIIAENKYMVYVYIDSAAMQIYNVLKPTLQLQVILIERI